MAFGKRIPDRRPTSAQPHRRLVLGINWPSGLVLAGVLAATLIAFPNLRSWTWWFGPRPETASTVGFTLLAVLGALGASLFSSNWRSNSSDGSPDWCRDYTTDGDGGGGDSGGDGGGD